MRLRVMLGLLCLVFVLCACKKKQTKKALGKVRKAAISPRSALTSKRKNPQAKAASRKGNIVKRESRLPKVGVVSRFEQGDIACYIFVRDSRGKEHDLMGDFSFCEKSKHYLKKRVKLTYHKIRVSNCQPGVKCKPAFKMVDGIKEMVLVK